MSLEKEEWLPVSIENHQIKGKYLVSNFGRIKSFTSNEQGKHLKGTKIEGYPAIRFRTLDGKLITRYVHHLVASHFLAPKEPHHRVLLHLDYNKENNSSVNLKWANKEEQIIHRMQGPNHRRGVITNSKLTEG